MLNPKEVLINLLVQALLAHKDEYIARGVEALAKYLQALDTDKDGSPDVQEALEQIEKVAAQVQTLYLKLLELASKYGFKVTPKA